jgi:hypothetical protein
MKNAAKEPSSRPHGHDRRIRVLSSIPAFESFSQRATDFVSGPWGTIALFGILASWGITVPLVGWTKAYEWISKFITVASFILFRAPVHDASRTWRISRRYCTSRQQPSRLPDSTTSAHYLRLFHTCNNFDFFQGEQYDARQ